jgi:hypothetical protein
MYAIPSPKNIVANHTVQLSLLSNPVAVPASQSIAQTAGHQNRAISNGRTFMPAKTMSIPAVKTIIAVKAADMMFALFVGVFCL